MENKSVCRRSLSTGESAGKVRLENGETELQYIYSRAGRVSVSPRARGARQRGGLENSGSPNMNKRARTYIGTLIRHLLRSSLEAVSHLNKA